MENARKITITGYQLINLLPSHTRMQILDAVTVNDCLERKFSIEDSYKAKRHEILGIILTGIDWDKSEEGFWHWAQVYTDVREGFYSLKCKDIIF